MALVHASGRTAPLASSKESDTLAPSHDAEQLLIDALGVLRAGASSELTEDAERLLRASLRLAGAPIRLVGRLDDACAHALATFKQRHGLPFDAVVDPRTAALVLGAAAFAVGAPGTGAFRRLRGSRFDATVAPHLLVEAPGLALFIRMLRRGVGR